MILLLDFQIITRLTISSPKLELSKFKKWSPEELVSLYSKLDKYPDLASELKNEKLFEAVETILRNPENAWDALRDLKDAEVVGKGRAFEQKVFDDLVAGFTSKTGKAYDAVKAEMQALGKNIDDYTMFRQVQLDVPDGKMIADQVLVKYKRIGNKEIIEDVIVLENKLKDVTDYTTKQKSGWSQINSGNKMSVRSVSVQDEINKVNKKILNQGDGLPISSVVRVDGGVNGQFDELAAAVEDLSKF